MNKGEMRKCLMLVSSTEERSKDRDRESPELEAFLGSGSHFCFYLTLWRHSSS